MANEKSKANLKPFAKGNPGRPKGSKNKLAENFWADLQSAWEKHGSSAVEHLATEEPSKFVQVVASVMPKEITVERLDSLSHEQLDARIAELAGKLGIALGAGEASGGEGEPPTAH